MTLSPIRKLVKKTRQITPQSLGRHSFTYVDISSVDKDAKSITNPQFLSVDEAPSRARKEIKANDVLVATVRPNLNGVAIVPELYDNEIASTGFCVLRTDETKLDPHFLFYFTQTIHFVERLTKLSIGAGYPAVSDEDILDTEIPLPPLPEQRRIADLLYRADRLRCLRRVGDTLSASLLQSVFLEMFGDPKYKSKKWELSLAGDLFKKIGYGVGTPPPFTTSGLPFLRAMNIKPNRIKLDNVVYFSSEYEKEMSRSRVNGDDIVIVRRGANTGDTAVIPPELDGAYVGYDLILRPDHKKLSSQYFVSLLNTTHVRGYLYQIRERAAQQGLNAEQISELVIPVPPLPEQEQFAAVVRRVESLRARAGESARQGEGLFQSLLSQAFG